MSTEWSKPTRYIVAVGMVLFGLYILYLSAPVLTLLVIAALVAFLLMPVVSFFQRHLKLPKVLAVLLSYLLLIIVLLLAPLLLIPPVLDGINVLIKVDYQILVQNLFDWAEQTLITLNQAQPHILGFAINLSGVATPALEALQDIRVGQVGTLPSFETIFNSARSALTITLDVATSVAGTVLSGALTFVLTLLYSIYLSLDADKLGPRFLKIVPEPFRPEIATLMARLTRTWRAYFRGQIILMFTIGILTLIGNTAIGLPGAITMAVIAGLLELIPNLGPILAAVPAILIALLQGSTVIAVNNFWFALIVAGLYILIQQLENNFIVPRVLGEAVELHPLVIMIGVVVGTSAAGILGALLAAPVMASIKEIMSYMYAKILDEDPFPPPAEKPEEPQPAWTDQVQAWLVRSQQVLNRLYTGKKPTPLIPKATETQEQRPFKEDQSRL